MRACWRIVLIIGCSWLLFASGAEPARAETQPFARPASIEPQIDFWVDIFTAYSYRDFVLMDRDDPYKIYQVYHLAGEGCPNRDDIDWVNTYLKTKYADILNRLASGAEPQGSDERHVAEMFKGRTPYAFRLAADNLPGTGRPQGTLPGRLAAQQILSPHDGTDFPDGGSAG